MFKNSVLRAITGKIYTIKMSSLPLSEHAVAGCFTPCYADSALSKVQTSNVFSSWKLKVRFCDRTQDCTMKCREGYADRLQEMWYVQALLMRVRWTSKHWIVWVPRSKRPRSTGTANVVRSMRLKHGHVDANSSHNWQVTRQRWRRTAVVRMVAYSHSVSRALQ